MFNDGFFNIQGFRDFSFKIAVVVIDVDYFEIFLVYCFTVTIQYISK